MIETPLSTTKSESAPVEELSNTSYVSFKQTGSHDCAEESAKADTKKAPGANSRIPNGFPTLESFPTLEGLEQMLPDESILDGCQADPSLAFGLCGATTQIKSLFSYLCMSDAMPKRSKKKQAREESNSGSRGNNESRDAVDEDPAMARERAEAEARNQLYAKMREREEEEARLAMDSPKSEEEKDIEEKTAKAQAQKLETKIVSPNCLA